ENDTDRQRKPRHFSTGRNLIQRAKARAGIGLDLEGDIVAPGWSGFAWRNSDAEFRFVEFHGRKFGRDGSGQLSRGRFAPGSEVCGGLVISGAGLGFGFDRSSQRIVGLLDLVELEAQAPAQAGKLIGVDIVLAAEG